MFKKSSLAIAAVLLASSASSFAATATANVSVSATLTPVCTISASNINLTYTSFQAEDSSNTGALTIKCTQGQAYGLSISNTTGSSVLGLNYTVGIVGASSGTAVSTGTGTGANETDKVVKATIAANQGGAVSGSNATYTATSATTHTVTVTY